MVLYKKNKTKSSTYEAKAEMSEPNLSLSENKSDIEVTVPKEVPVDAQVVLEKVDTLTDIVSVDAKPAELNLADERLKRKVEELKSSDSTIDHLKAMLIESDTSKIDNLSDTLNNASKSKTFGIIVIFIAILLAFAFK
jgi:hypothetical protein